MSTAASQSADARDIDGAERRAACPALIFTPAIRRLAPITPSLYSRFGTFDPDGVEEPPLPIYTYLLYRRTQPRVKMDIADGVHRSNARGKGWRRG